MEDVSQAITISVGWLSQEAAPSSAQINSYLSATLYRSRNHGYDRCATMVGPLVEYLPLDSFVRNLRW